MKDETLSLIVIAFIVISGVSWAIFAGISLILFLPLEIVAGVFLVAVAAAVRCYSIHYFCHSKAIKRVLMWLRIKRVMLSPPVFNGA